MKNFEIPYGVCELDSSGSLTLINEKPEQDYLVLTGFYLMNPDVIDIIPSNTFFNINELIQKSLKMNMKVGVYPVTENAWIDIGQWEEYKLALEKLDFGKKKI